jgi:hypothetical protein
VKPGDSVATASLAERAHRLPDHLTLVVVTGADCGKSLALSRGTFTVGKSKSSSLVLTDPAVSRTHLQIVVLPDAVEIRDLGSRNGSFFGGARFERIRVGVGAAVRIGSTEMEVHTWRPTAPAWPASASSSPPATA